MTPENRPYTSTHPDWYDPFPEPRTFPGGWDLSELPHYECPPDADTGWSVAAAPDALPAGLTECRPDPFPQPRTWPGGWNLADVLALECERMAAKDREQEQASFVLPPSVGVLAYQAV